MRLDRRFVLRFAAITALLLLVMAYSNQVSYDAGWDDRGRAEGCR